MDQEAFYNFFSNIFTDNHSIGMDSSINNHSVAPSSNLLSNILCFETKNLSEKKNNYENITGRSITDIEENMTEKSSGQIPENLFNDSFIPTTTEYAEGDIRNLINLMTNYLHKKDYEKIKNISSNFNDDFVNYYELHKLRHIETKSDLQRKYDEMKVDNFFGSLPYSLYGNLIFGCMQSYDSDILRYIVLFLFAVPTLVCFLIQLILLIELWESLPDLNDPINSGFCRTDNYFQLALIASFIIYMYQPCCNVLSEALFIDYLYTYGSDSYDIVTDQWTKITWSKLHKFNIFLIMLSIVMEAGIICIILIVGARYILSSIGASSLVQAVLSIVFVSEISVQLANLIIPLKSKQKIESYKVFCPWIPTQEYAPGKEDTGYALFSVFCKLPIACGVVVGIVFGLRTVYCN